MGGKQTGATFYVSLDAISEPSNQVPKDFNEPEEPSPDKIQIFLECWRDNELTTLSLFSKPSDTIMDLKKKMQQRTQVPPIMQVIQQRTEESKRFKSRCVCHELVCENDKTLSECGITNNDILSLVYIN